MTRSERRWLLGCAIVLALACSVLFARAVLAQRTADLARAQARAAFLSSRKTPTSDFTERAMLGWTGSAGQMRFWEALQRFRLVTRKAKSATDYTLLPPLSVIFSLEETISSLRKTAAEDDSRQRRSRLEDMLGLAYFYDAELHRGEFPVEPQLVGSAVSAFRNAVLLDSSNEAAKTNLELLLLKQRRTHQPQEQHPKLLPDQSRVLSLIQGANGLPSLNGAVGRRIHGGY